MIQQHMVISHMSVIGKHADEARLSSNAHGRFFDQFALQGVENRLTAFDTAPRKEQAFGIGMAHQENFTCRILNDRPRAKSHRPR